MLDKYVTICDETVSKVIKSRRMLKRPIDFKLVKSKEKKLGEKR